MINTDASFQEKSLESYLDGVIIAAAAFGSFAGSALEVEATALADAHTVAAEFGLRRVVSESDYKDLINACNQSGKRWKIRSQKPATTDESP